MDNPLHEIDNLLDEALSLPEPPVSNTPETEEVAEEPTNEAPPVRGPADELDISQYFAPEPSSPKPAPEVAAKGQEEDVQARIRQLEMELLEHRVRAETLAQMHSHAAPIPAQDTPAEPEPAPSFFDGDEDLDLTPEEKEVYGASLPVIEKIAKQMLRRYHATEVDRLRETVGKVSEQHQTIQSEVQQSRQSAFMSEILAAVPDLHSRVNSPGWQAYLQQPLPFTGGQYTIGQHLQMAAARGDRDSTVEVLKGYNMPQDPTPSMVSPGTSQTSTPSTTPRQVQKFAYSKYEEASEKARTGKMTYAEFEKVQNAFFEAESRGAVDYSA